MMKLTQEQQARTQVEDKLEEAYHKLWQQQGGKGLASSKQNQSGLWSWFSSNGNNNPFPVQNNKLQRTMSFTGKNSGFTDREQNVTRALEQAQFRISQLTAELEANKEAQTIVLETKESVMRSLARQNSQLTLEVKNNSFFRITTCLLTYIAGL
jgi:hypothetical protein